MLSTNMQPNFQALTTTQVPELLPLMRQLYEHTGMPWSPNVAESALGELLRSPAKGGVWLVRVEGVAVGYLVLTMAFSLEFGGTFALLDELYIVSQSRSMGIGGATLRFAEEQARELGAATLRLETGTDNLDAVRFYERHGLVRDERYLMTKRLP